MFDIGVSISFRLPPSIIFFVWRWDQTKRPFMDGHKL